MIQERCLAISAVSGGKSESAGSTRRSPDNETGNLKCWSQHVRFGNLSRADAISQQATWTWLGLADGGINDSEFSSITIKFSLDAIWNGEHRVRVPEIHPCDQGQ